MYDFEEEKLYGKSKLLEELKKNTGVCMECGKTFEQGFKLHPKTGDKIFNKYKYCLKCRNEIAKKNQEQKTTQVKIKYNPYPWQKKFHASKARFKVVSGAARSGKDYSFDKEFDMKFVDMLNEDRGYSLIPRVHGWIIGPTYKLLSQIERNFMHNFPRELVVSYDKENHVIETVNGGLIEFRSADDPDSLVSVGLDICYITEAARIKQFDVVIGNLTDRLDSPGRGPNGTGGLMLINSSPRGRSFFNEVCKWGIDGGSKQRPDWETWYISRWDNPTFADRRNKVFDKRINKWVERGDDPYLANERTYEQDLMLSRSDRQYRGYAEIEKPLLNREQMREYIRKLRTPEPNFTYSIGYDPAKQVDGAWLVVYCEQTGEVVELVRLENVPYTVQINLHIKQLVKKWNYAMVRYGKTGLGEALEDIFKMAGIAYIAYAEQGRNKEKLVENLTTLVKEGKFKIHNVDDIAETAIRQFEDYGYDVSEKAKTITYGNMTAGQHDDAVSASYFAVADIVVDSLEEASKFYDSDNMIFIKNKNTMNRSIQGAFY